MKVKGNPLPDKDGRRMISGPGNSLSQSTKKVAEFGGTSIDLVYVIEK